MTTPDTLELRRKAEAATPGPWDVYGERINGNIALAAAEALSQVNQTGPIADHFWMMNAAGKCPALTGCGPTSEANAAFIAAANPAVILALLDRLDALEGREDWKAEWEAACSERIKDREKTQEIINGRDQWIVELIRERDALVALVREGMEEAIPDALIFGMHTNAETWIKAKEGMQHWLSKAKVSTTLADEGRDQ